MIKTAMMFVNYSNIIEPPHVKLGDISSANLKKYYRSYIIILIYKQEKEYLQHLCDKLLSYIEEDD